MRGIFKAGKFELELGKRTYIMGILNVTPDSFSDGGKWFDAQTAVNHALEMAEQGADIIDIGGQSTRPGHTPVSPCEEFSRIEPVLKELIGRVDIPISIDTYYPVVAKECAQLGASIINDVSGQTAKEMAEVVRDFGLGRIAMHTGADFEPNVGEEDIPDLLEELMQAKEMLAAKEYPDGIAKDVKAFFKKFFFAAVGYGVAPEQLCFDSGIGFGKSYEQNLDLLRDVAICRLPSCPLLIGASRKRVIGEAGGETDPLKRLAGTPAANTAAIAGGADILRVHDVAQSVQAARVADAIYRR